MDNWREVAAEWGASDCRTRRAAAAVIIAKVATKHGAWADDLTGRDRRPWIVEARREAVREVRRLNLGYVEMGEIFGKRDHTTMIHYCKETTV